MADTFPLSVVDFLFMASTPVQVKVRETIAGYNNTAAFLNSSKLRNTQFTQKFIRQSKQCP